MDWLAELLRRARRLVVGPARHRAGVVPDLRAAAAHPRHARGADGAQRRLPASACSSSRGGSSSRPSTGSSATSPTYVVFAIIVLFQADIRRALAHFGRAPFFRYFERASSADETIEELVVAATTLAARRIGAIIVIERQIGLRNYIEGGIPLDAHGHLRPAGQHLPARLAAARRRRDRPGRPHRGRRLLPSAVGQPARQPRSRHAAPRGARPDRRERRHRHRRVRGDRDDLAGDRRRPRARPRRADALRDPPATRCSASAGTRARVRREPRSSLA